MIIPVIHKGILNVSSRAADIELACVKLPMPKEARTVNSAKRKPSILPTFLFLKA